MEKDLFDHDCPICKAMEQELWEEFDEDEIDHDSNHVVDLIEAGRLEEAEAAACELLKKYPDAIDGVDRLASVFEAKGDLARAIQYYESAIAFTRVYAGFDEASREYYRKKISELQAKLP